MTFRDALRMAISSLRGRFMRTLLTILGLGVGVGAVLAVLTLGKAGETRVEQEIAKLGVDKVWIRPLKQSVSISGELVSRIRAAVSAPACAGAYSAVPVISGGRSILVQIAGFDEGMTAVHAPKLTEGRLFIPQDYSAAAPVCLIDEALRDQLSSQPVGAWITIAGRRLRIVGVIKRMTAQMMSGGNGLLIMPLGTYRATLGGETAEITIAVQQNQNAGDVAQAALQSLDNQSAYRADTLEKEIGAAREIVRIFVMVLVCVAFVCVLTGSIGVMNVLMISIRERRTEIGLLKAIGGTALQVGFLFLLEAAAYAVLGGILGIALGLAMIRMFGLWIGLDARLAMMDALLVLIGAALIGLAFGVIPAIKAASLQPVEALQSE